MKMYVKFDDCARSLILAVLNGERPNITVRFGDKPYCCFEIWGNYINTVKYIQDFGCTEYVFPRKEK